MNINGLNSKIDYSIVDGYYIPTQTQYEFEII